MPSSPAFPLRALTVSALACLLAGGAQAQTAAKSQGVGDGPTSQANPVPGGGNAKAAESEPSPGEPGFTTQLFSSSRTNLLGDIYGLRSTLGSYGISLGAQETAEVFGNVTGGQHRGATFDGLLQVSLGLDTARAFGWEGGTFNISAFQIHGRNLATDNLLNLQTNSGIEANRATRLWELWYQQAAFNGRVDVKIGQQSLDQEFIGSQYSGLFINTMMGWPLIPSYDLYAGGPAYPLSSLGVRLRVQPINNVTVLAGIFDDNPPGGPFNDDSQVRGSEQAGTRFNLQTGALIFGEVQYAINQPAIGELDRADTKRGLPGVYKLGGWYDTGKFPDQRIDTTGLSLADPNSNGIARSRKNNFSIYGVFDQMIWRPDPDEARAIGIFARLMGSPGDRNLISFSVNGGIEMKAPFEGRDNDSVGLGFGVGRLSNSAIKLDRDQNAFGNAKPVRSSETFIELTYQYSVAPWWQVQPDFQYVWTPGGGITNPLNPAKRIGNETIFGVRSSVVF